MNDNILMDILLYLSFYDIVKSVCFISKLFWKKIFQPAFLNENKKNKIF